MRTYAQFGILFAGLTLAASASITAGAGVRLFPALQGQHNVHPNGGHQENPHQNVHQGVPTGAARSEKTDRPNPGAWLERFHNLPADQQLKAMEADPDFKRLTSQQQQELRERLIRFNQHNPQQQQRMIERIKKIESLPEDQKRQVRSAFQAVRNLPAERQNTVRRAVWDLDNMSPEQRQQVMESDRFRLDFSENERTVISNVLSAEATLDAAKPDTAVGSAPPK